MSPNRAASNGLAAALALLVCVACSHATNASLPQTNLTQSKMLGFPQFAAEKFLYSVSADGQVYSYPLPITQGEQPNVKLNVQGGALAAGRNDLYVSLKNGTEVAEYRLPLVAGEKSSANLPIANDNALAYSAGYVYVGDGGSGTRPNQVAAYVAPLKRGEHPAAVIRLGKPLLDFPVAIALDSKSLYVLKNDSLLSYSLPLKTGEAASVTIAGFNSAAGLAVSGDRLFVSSYDLADVYVYALPLKSGENAAATLKTGFEWAGSLAADAAHVYVSDTSGSAWVYPLPIRTREQPGASVSNSRNIPAQTLSVSP